MKTRKIGLIFAAAVATAVIVLAGCPTAVRPPPLVRVDLFNLQDWLAAQEPGPVSGAALSSTTPLRFAGYPVLTVVEEGGGRALRVELPGPGWHGLDVPNDVAAFRVGDQIQLVGTTSGAGFQIFPTSAWGQSFGASGGGTFSWNDTLTLPQVSSLTAIGQYGAPAGFRIRMNADAARSFTITGFSLSGYRLIGWERPWEEPEPPLPPVPDSPWTAVRDSRYIGNRGGVALGVTMEGIVVSGRGTSVAAWDNNNGIAFDINGMRALIGGSPDIVITGTVVEGIDAVQLHGLAVPGGDGNTISAPVTDGAFVVTVPGTANIDMTSPDDWFASTLPFLGTPQNQFGNYTITGIYVDDVSIIQLLGMDGGGDDEGTTWTDVANSRFIGSYDATLNVVSNGIMVWERGDGDGGLSIDIEGLRELVGGNPSITITGTTGPRISRIYVQGTDVYAYVVSGTFTVTIAGNVEIDLLDGEFPVLTTPVDEIQSYTVTGIMIGGVSILNIDLLAPPPPPSGVHETVFDLAHWLAGQALGPLASGPVAGTPLVLNANADGPTFAIVEEGSVRGIEVSGITDQGWHGINVVNSVAAFDVDDEISLAGRLVSGVGAERPGQMVLHPNNLGWEPLLHLMDLQNGDDFDSNFTLTESQVADLRAAGQHGQAPGFRIRANDLGTTGTFIITQLVIEGYRVPQQD